MTFIIAEVGSNHESLQDCLDSIIAAKQAGADACKFQLFTHKELYGYDGEMAGVMPREWIPILHSKCQEVQIEFMATAFSSEGYRFIDPFVKRHKIASAENSDSSILVAVADLGKPILMSTGGSDFREIRTAADILRCASKQEVTVMYCVSAYPAKNIDLGCIDDIRNLLKMRAGYSCHSDEWMTPALAVQDHLALVIEKHFKIRDMDTPDNPHSILPEDFKKMVGMIREYKCQFPHPDEAEFVQYAKRRWIPELGGYYRTKKP